MTIYTFSEARQKFASVLDRARIEGKVLIKRKDGSVFVIQPFTERGSPLDVKGTNINLSTEEIIDFIQEVRKR